MSYTISIVDSSGKEKSKRNLSEAIFSDSLVNEGLIHEYVVMYLANQRQSTAHTKTRGEVQRSGRKLFRQKGTGRARVGDAGSPIRRKGGVAFGPRNTTDRSKEMPKKMKRKALCGALTLKAKSLGLYGIDGITLSTPKTSEAASLLKSLSLSDKKTLVVLGDSSSAVLKSFANIPTVTTVSAQLINAYDVMTHKNILFTASGLDVLEKQFTS